jgi:hypothetical protein
MAGAVSDTLGVMTWSATGLGVVRGAEELEKLHVLPTVGVPAV